MASDAAIERLLLFFAIVIGIFIICVIIAYFTYKSKLSYPIKVIFYGWLLYITILNYHSAFPPDTISPHKESSYPDEYFESPDYEKNSNPESLGEKIAIHPALVFLISSGVVLTLVLHNKKRKKEKV